MSKLKITDVQVDCNDLTQEQIYKMCEILERNKYTKSYICPSPTLDKPYISITKLTNMYGFYSKGSKYTTITYDEFINLFDKPKFKPKKAIKELEQRIALLEQKLSEKDAENTITNTFSYHDTLNDRDIILNTSDRICFLFKEYNKVLTILGFETRYNFTFVHLYNETTTNKQISSFDELIRQIIKDEVVLLNDSNINNKLIEIGAKFKEVETNWILDVVAISEDNVYFTDRCGDVEVIPIHSVENSLDNNCWIPLPPTEKKESELTKGAICKFWNDDENSYEIGRYEPVSYMDSSSITHKHVNILTLDTFKNAKVISVDEALELFKKQLLNEN